MRLRQLAVDVCREGLDWLVAEVPKHGVRLLLTLTNGGIGYGGMLQYTQWANLSTVQVRATAQKPGTGI